MTKEAFAASITGREYPFELAKQEEALAKEFGLLIVFGASDDLLELRGAIHDEEPAYGGTTVHVSRDGFLMPGIYDDDEAVLKKHGVLEAARDRQKDAIRIEQYWEKEGGTHWAYKTEEPHATFDVMEDGELYCRGIVVQL